MNKNSWKVGLCAGAVCIFTSLAGAAPLQRADVAANPAWVLHLDCDALRPTTVGQYILSEMDKPMNKAKLGIFQSLFGFDLRTQLHGVTLYGTSADSGDGVLMVYADFDPEHLVNLAQAAKDYQSSPHGKYTIHSWIDDKKKAKNGGEPPRTYAAIQDHHVIFGQREEAVARALDVAGSNSSSLAGGNVFADLGQAGNGHVVEAAAQKMKVPDADPSAAILKLSQSIQLVLGESDNQLNGKVTLVADSADVSGHILSIAQGLLALMKLQTDKPDSVKLANAIDLKQDGERVVGTLTMPSADVVDMMKADAARKAAQPKKDE